MNAGHNAPIFLRRTADNGTRVIRLDTGGPVTGLLPQAPYQQGSLLLEPGDLFVGYTDGISETWNNDEDEWGEERLIDTATACFEEPATDIIPAIMRHADTFAAVAPQHDDMTLIIVPAPPMNGAN